MIKEDTIIVKVSEMVSISTVKVEKDNPIVEEMVDNFIVETINNNSIVKVILANIIFLRVI